MATSRMIPPDVRFNTTCSEGPSAAQWEERKDEIRMLYEKKPLKEVKHILEKQYGFRATERMFKSRLSTWGYSKNSSDKGWKVCAVLHHQRRQKGKNDSIFYINGNSRSLKDLKKYVKGRKMSDDEFLADALKSVDADQMDDHIRALTPDGSDVESDHGAEPRRQRRHSRLSSSSNHVVEPRSIPRHDAVFTPDSASSPLTISRRKGSTRSSPRRSFGRSDIESLAYSTLYSTSLPQTYGVDNLDGWAMMGGTSSDTASLSDYDIICPRCHRLNTEHFNSDCSFDSPSFSPSPRDIINPSPDLPANNHHFALPQPTKQHDHSWKWMSHCFSACIYYSRSRYTESSTHNLTQPTPLPNDAPADFSFARWDLDRAKESFAQMIQHNDPNTLVALCQTVAVLSMHNWGNISSHIMRVTAHEVALSLLPPTHPLCILTHYTVLSSSASTLYTQTAIDSTALRTAWQTYAQGSPTLSIPAYGETSRQAIPAMYMYASQLLVEAHCTESPTLRMAKHAEVEYILLHGYRLACETFHAKHLQPLQIAGKLSLCLERQARLAEALEWAERVLRDGEETLGRWHPRRLETMRGVAELHVRLGHGEKGVELLWEVLEGRVRMLGKKHEATMAGRERLVELLGGKGNGEMGLGERERERLADIWDWTDVGGEMEDSGVGEGGGGSGSAKMGKGVMAGY